MVERLFLAVPRGCLQFVIVVFPDHTHLLFLGAGPGLHIHKLDGNCPSRKIGCSKHEKTAPANIKLYFTKLLISLSIVIPCIALILVLFKLLVIYIIQRLHCHNVQF